MAAKYLTLGLENDDGYERNISKTGLLIRTVPGRPLPPL
jgi:hypothetical protein